ncbi:MAG: hypothetical protein VKO65_08740, partial [Cyanobacteriota bacterium]|nr:hypothetical protein [Cyanobacteriota bacterium]
MTTAPRIDGWTVIGSIAAHRWLAQHRSEAWLILTASQLVHLGQIGLYYRLGKSCPLTVWLITIPVWLVMLAVTLVVLTRPQLLAGGGSGGSRWAGAFYAAGLWVVWLVFLLAFALGSAAGHLLAYNLPALLLFLAAASLHTPGSACGPLNDAASPQSASISCRCAVPENRSQRIPFTS